MKNRLMLTLIGIILVGCSNEDVVPNPHNCQFETFISAAQFDTAPSDNLVVNTLEINEGCLKINFSSGGCSGGSWELKLIDSGAILESYPPQRNVRLSLKNNESCLAYINKEVTFDISNLQVDGNKVLLNITNANKSILYEY